MTSFGPKPVDFESNGGPEKGGSRASAKNAIALVTEIVVHMTAAIVTYMSVAYSVEFVGVVSQRIHITFCVCGYQFLMAEAIMLKSEGSSWSDVLNGKQKRTLHWVLQVLGSAMAIIGTVIRIGMSVNHFYTLHGIFGLVAFVCTIVCLINGLTSLYAYELRGCCSSQLSKITHIFFGAATLVFASISLCYGFEKAGYIAWSSVRASNTMIIFTSILTALVLVKPFILMGRKTKAAFSS